MARDFDIYQHVTDQMIEHLESGKDVPWKKGWAAAPTNYTTKKPYSGINVLQCWLSGEKHEFGSNYWLTFNQARKLKATVKKGSKSTMILFWKQSTKSEAWKEKERKNGVENSDDTYLVLRYYRVFNIEQTDIDIQNGVQEPPQLASIVDTLRSRHDLTLTLNPGRACYRPDTDVVSLPSTTSFDSDLEYAGTLCHELIHWTAPRLGRTITTKDTAKYAFEELVAEIGAAMMLARLGIVGDAMDENHGAYVKGWLGALKNDKKYIFKAASQARAAVDFLMTEKEEVEA